MRDYSPTDDEIVIVPLKNTNWTVWGDEVLEWCNSLNITAKLIDAYRDDGEDSCPILVYKIKDPKKRTLFAIRWGSK